MKIKRLEGTEKINTRAIWEEVFPDDSERYLDYYYNWKTGENAIYGLEQDGIICSMIHLNPYTMHMGTQLAKSAYIVAVATLPPYRRRKYMAKLLEECLCDMAEQKLPFTFLMPAAEAIYRPHGFRYVYNQSRISLRQFGAIETEIPPEHMVMSPAKPEECGELAELAEQVLGGEMNVYAFRDGTYYRRLLVERDSEGGIIMTVRRKGKLVGSLLVYEEENLLDIREPFFLEEASEMFLDTLKYLEKESQKRIVLYAAFCWQQKILEPYTREYDSKPVIMARIASLKAWSGILMSEGSAVTLRICVQDEVIEANNGIWNFSTDDSGCIMIEKEKQSGLLAAEMYPVVSVSVLTEILFGAHTSETLKRDIEAGEICELSCEELSCFMTLTGASRVYLNEIV